MACVTNALTACCSFAVIGCGVSRGRLLVMVHHLDGYNPASDRFIVICFKRFQLIREGVKRGAREKFPYMHDVSAADPGGNIHIALFEGIAAGCRDLIDSDRRRLLGILLGPIILVDVMVEVLGFRDDGVDAALDGF
jgi:hypothetical protein